ncbi:MAG: hypothetical protein WDA08_00735 [Weeksellaceae bacterium]
MIRAFELQAEILFETPQSGQFEEIHFGENFNESLWIKFIVSESVWEGCFSKQNTNCIDKVLIDNDSLNALVVTGGNGYLINAKNRNLIFQTDEYPLIESAIQSYNPNFFFASTYCGVYVFNEKGLQKEIKPEFMVDGIYLDYQDNSKIITKIDSVENQYTEKIEVAIDLEKLEFDSLYNKISINLFKRFFK